MYSIYVTQKVVHCQNASWLVAIVTSLKYLMQFTDTSCVCCVVLCSRACYVVSLQVADVVKSQDEIGLGIDLDSMARREDNADDMPSRHFVRYIQLEGAVGTTGLIHVDDELLAVSLMSLYCDVFTVNSVL